ncbi:MAG: gliding motility-associated C-terminal domain-containing protein [Flavobacteriales bacterium]|nr:gliding motility-associated C-terminal domain-containing protein [Flavobacteriales bacterium]
MLHKRLTHALLAVLLALPSLQLTAQLSVSIPQADQEEPDFFRDRENWTELTDKREVYSSSYKTPDNRVIIHYSKQPLNYYNAAGKLVPVNLEPVATGNGYRAMYQPNPVSVLNDGTVELTSPDHDNLRFSGNARINGISITTGQASVHGKSLSMTTNIPGLTKEFTFRFNSLKYNYVMQNALSSNSASLILEEELVLPQGAILEPDGKGSMKQDGWHGGLTIKDEAGNLLGSIRGALCYDAKGSYITAAYQTSISNGVHTLQIILPNSWINAPGRSYPITIDPLVTGPTSTYTGPDIPSCISPNSGSDSIQVTIPAQITVTGLIVSGSYYADPFTTAIMNDGAMFFQTSCGATSNYTTTGSTGTLPGTAYLTAANLKSPLTCCIPQSCSAQTFYLSMHISRTAGGSGCNNTYIYHDPNGAYPFSAYVEGYTVEGFGPVFNTSATSLCSDECDIAATTYIRYGVPPFTITHPWMTGSLTVGSPAGCSTASNINNLSLTIPNCPTICDTTTSITVPAPTVVDACGNVVTGIASKTISITQVPDITATPPSITMCSGDTFSTTLSSCIPSSTINWSGNGGSGTGGSVSQSITNTGTTVSSTDYDIYADNNGCLSDTITFSVNTVPIPVANFGTDPNPTITNIPVTFTDNSTTYGGGSGNWFWTFGDGSYSSQPAPTHTYTTPGTYEVCLFMETTEGCQDTLCSTIEVIPAELTLPNVITPNGDNLNDYLIFENLEYFGSNNLKVYNRWGKLLYEQDNYANDWSPKDLSDGTYFYILTLENGEIYESYLELLK